jgi:hypothetical protein
MILAMIPLAGADGIMVIVISFWLLFWRADIPVC